jgi:hypothetical protein
VLLPRQGPFVTDIENLGRKLILVDFGSAGEEYLFPDEIFDEIPTASDAAANQLRSWQARRSIL